MNKEYQALKAAYDQLVLDMKLIAQPIKAGSPKYVEKQIEKRIKLANSSLKNYGGL